MVKPFAGARKQPLPAEAIAQMIALYNAGQWQALEASARLATQRHPEHIFGWKALAKSLLVTGRASEAGEALARVLKAAPNDPEAAADMGEVLHRQGDLAKA